MAQSPILVHLEPICIFAAFRLIVFIAETFNTGLGVTESSAITIVLSSSSSSSSSSSFFFLFHFLGLQPQHMEVPRLGVESELRLPVTTTAVPDPSRICHLHP